MMNEEFNKAEEEKVKQMKQQIQDLEIYKKSHPSGGSFSKNIDDSRVSVKDPFSHAMELLRSKNKDPKCYADLWDQNILLGDISDQKTLLLYQRDYRILTAMFGLGKRSPAMMDLFQREYQTFLMQIRMTSAMGGAERSYQAMQVPDRIHKGFVFGSRRGKAKKRQDIQDYLTPQEEPGIYE